MAPPNHRGTSPRTETADKVNIYARVSAKTWARIQEMSGDNADEKHYQRSASQIVDLALQEYVSRHPKKKPTAK